MSTIHFNEFSVGLDHRKSSTVADSNRLRELKNAYITTGKVIRKRPGLPKIATLEAGTKGLVSGNGVLNTFYEFGAAVVHADTRFVGQVLEHAAGAGYVPGDIAKIHYGTVFLGFLAQLAQEYQGRHGILVLDNASYHTAAVVRSYLAELGSTFEVIWLPPYCPELNDIERIWKYVKGASLANYDFGGVATLREAIVEVFDELNASTDTDLTLRFRDPLSKHLLQVA